MEESVGHRNEIENAIIGVGEVACPQRESEVLPSEFDVTVENGVERFILRVGFVPIGASLSRKSKRECYRTRAERGSTLEAILQRGACRKGMARSVRNVATGIILYAVEETNETCIGESVCDMEISIPSVTCPPIA